MTESSWFLTGAFAAVVLAALYYISHLTNIATSLRAENAALKTQVGVLMDILGTYWSSEKERTLSHEREAALDAALQQLNALRLVSQGGITMSGGTLNVGHDLTGRDKEESK